MISEEKLFLKGYGTRPAYMLPFGNETCSGVGEHDTPVLEEESEILRDFGTFQNRLAGTPAIRTILSPTGHFKHEKDCKALLLALRSFPNLQDALEKHSCAWDMRMKQTQPNASAAERDIREYAGRALSGYDPIKIAKIVQIVAMATQDTEAFEKLVVLVDQLILSNDEYLSTLEGLECAFEQGRFHFELGLIYRSW
jgi:hypothetical protein